MQDMQPDHAVVKSRIDMVRGDILYIQEKIAEIKRRRSPAKPRAVKGGTRGRRRNLDTLLAELQALEAMRAYLHAELVKLRGEPVFSGVLGDLEKLGIVAAPRKPVAGKRGRPSKQVMGPLIRFWVDLILAREAYQGNKSTVRQAGLEAQPIIDKIVRLRYRKSYMQFHEQDYYAEKRRIKKIRQPLKTRMK